MPLFGSGSRYGSGALYGGVATGVSSSEIRTPIDPKHGTLIAYAFSYVDPSGSTVWVKDVVPFDIDRIAELWDINVFYGTTGEVLPYFNGDDDCVAIYYTIAVGALPPDPTTASASITGRSGQPGSTGVFADFGEAGTVKARGLDADGNLGPILQKTWRRGDAAKFRPHVQVSAVRSTDQVTITVTVQDPALSVTAIQFRKQDSGGSLGGTWLSSWDSSTGTIGSSVSLTRQEVLTSDDGLHAQFMWRVVYTDENGDSQVIGDTIDLSKLVQITKEWRIAADLLTPWDSNITRASGVFIEPLNASENVVLGAPVPLAPGCVITELRALLRREDADDTAEARLRYVTVVGGIPAATIFALAVKGAGAGYAEASSSAIAHAVVSGRTYIATILLNGVTFASDVGVGHIRVLYDMPSYDRSI